MSDIHDWEVLIDRHLRGELTDEEIERLTEWLDSDAASRSMFVEHVQWDTDLTEAIREQSPSEVVGVKRVPEAIPSQSRMRSLGALLVVCTFALIVVVAGLYYQRPNPQPLIAKVTGLAGPLQWTGSGGQVSHDLTVGAALPGGTIESLAPESWFELQFRDGSSVTITGDSLLTFSDAGQKVLHLRSGSFSGNIRPQPPGKPMLIHTRSALLEVLGTQFGLEAEAWSTALNVNEGTVRMTRLSDGESAEVPAWHRAVAAIDRELRAEKMPESVSRWHTEIHRSPEQTFGRWAPPTESSPALLKNVPFQIPDGRTIFATGVGVVQADHPAVVIQEESRIRVRGQMSRVSILFVGVTLRDVNGELPESFRRFVRRRTSQVETSST